MSRDHGPKPYNVASERTVSSSLDANFENLVHNWDRLSGRLTIFLGAGASVGAKNRVGGFVPSALQLRNMMWRDLMCDATTRAGFDPAILGSMSLEHAAAIAEARTRRGAVEEYLVSQFDCAQPLWQHCVLPFLRPKALFTTNYDELIEKGWRVQASRNGVKELVLRHSSREDSPAPHTPLFKPHGTLQLASRDIGQGGLVITMFDYFRMIGDYKAMIERFLSDFNQSCVLFIGYAFMDMDIGAELFRLRRERRIPWYAIFPRDDADVRRMYEERFGILQINRRALDFLAELDERVNFVTPIEWKYRNLHAHRAAGTVQ